jgi:hypothetical protein
VKEWRVERASRDVLIFLADSAPVAQLDRASGYEPEGREFESPRAHHFPIDSGYTAFYPPCFTPMSFAMHRMASITSAIRNIWTTNRPVFKRLFCEIRLVGLDRFRQLPHARKGLRRKTLLLSLFFREVSCVNILMAS